jgi:hypothetical protein
MGAMATFEHLVKSYNVGDLLDDIASADPPAYLRRCFAEGYSASSLSWSRVQQLAVCSMVLDAVLNGRDYEFFEHELIADWRVHYASACAKLQETALRLCAACSNASGRKTRMQRPNSSRLPTDLLRLE